MPADSRHLQDFPARRSPREPQRPASDFDGKEGVDGSSPSEGFRVFPAQPPFPLPALTPEPPLGDHRASTARGRRAARLL